jgi:hypothetical protein
MLPESGDAERHQKHRREHNSFHRLLPQFRGYINICYCFSKTGVVESARNLDRNLANS